MCVCATAAGLVCNVGRKKKCREDKAYQNNLKNLEMKRLLSAMGSFENHLNETAVGSFCRSLFGDCGVCVPVPGHASVWF